MLVLTYSWMLHFMLLDPMFFSIPLLIYNNASIQIGIVVGPSESEILYDVIYKCINKITNSNIINRYPILTDEDTGLVSFAKYSSKI